MRNKFVFVLAMIFALTFNNLSFGQAKQIGKQLGKKVIKTEAKNGGKKVAKKATKTLSKRALKKTAKRGAKETAEAGVRGIEKEIAEKFGKEMFENGLEGIGKTVPVEKMAKKETRMVFVEESALQKYKSKVNSNMKDFAKHKAVRKGAKEGLSEGAEKGVKEGAEKGVKEGAEKASKNSTMSASDKYKRGKELDEMHTDPKKRQEMYDNLSPEDRKILDDYQRTKYSNSGYKNIPKSNGRWSGEPGNSKWYPDRDKVPGAKGSEGYNNPNGKTWGEILDENGIDGIPYKNGEPDFSVLAKMKTELDLDNGISDKARSDLLSPKKDRGQLHEEVYEKLARENNMTVEQLKAYKEANNLVVHECSDCKTILLIPREIHDNLSHGGGVEMLRAFNGL